MTFQRALQKPALATPALDAEHEPSAVDRAMNRYAEGDEGAFVEIFEALAPRLRAFLERLSGRRDLADDLTQETFLRMHRARGAFGNGREVLPWAYAIARNCYRDHLRAQGRARATSVDPEEMLGIATGPDADVEEAVRVKEAARVVEHALANMTVARREAFVLLRYEGLSVAAAAQVLGVSESALKVRAFHAYECLRAALATL